MGMRAGPATGLPTWNSQGDLRFVLHASQDEFPRIVLAAGDVEEAFELTAKAFNLAEKYQTPVVVLVDRYLCESHGCVVPFDLNKNKIVHTDLIVDEVKDYKRYALSENGISPRAIPGSGNHFIINSDEHDEIGYSAEDADNRNAQMTKRMKKLKTCESEDMEQPAVYGPNNADLTIVSWGSNKGPIIEAMKDFKNVNYLHLTWLNPFPTEYVKDILHKAKKVLNIEENYAGQMAGLIKEKTGYDMHSQLLKVDGRPFYPEEITRKIRSSL
jgi:2-oxoglutarate ferredoxin oxidoreductase subunit alpha